VVVVEAAGVGLGVGGKMWRRAAERRGSIFLLIPKVRLRRPGSIHAQNRRDNEGGDRKRDRRVGEDGLALAAKTAAAAWEGCLLFILMGPLLPDRTGPA